MENKVKISTQNLNLYYGENHALKNINLDLYENKITAFIGPSGCGKSTYLKMQKNIHFPSFVKKWEWCSSSQIHFQ